jgi:uncharacterized OsmC-like protein
MACTDRNAKQMLTTTDVRFASLLHDYLHMGLGACPSNGIKFIVSKSWEPIRLISVAVERERTNQLQMRFSDIHLKGNCNTTIMMEELQYMIDQGAYQISSRWIASQTTTTTITTTVAK